MSCKKYTVYIHEVLFRAVNVTAESAEEAKEIVEKKYYDGKIVLDSGDLSYREMKEESEEDYEEF